MCNKLILDVLKNQCDATKPQVTINLRALLRNWNKTEFQESFLTNMIILLVKFGNFLENEEQ